MEQREGHQLRATADERGFIGDGAVMPILKSNRQRRSISVDRSFLLLYCL